MGGFRVSVVGSWRRFQLFRYEGTYIYIYIYVCVRFSFKENWRSGQVIVHIDKVNALALHPFARFIRYLDLILVTRINATCQHLKYILTDVLLRHFIDIFLL